MVSDGNVKKCLNLKIRRLNVHKICKLKTIGD